MNLLVLHFYLLNTVLIDNQNLFSSIHSLHMP